MKTIWNQPDTVQSQFVGKQSLHRLILMPKLGKRGWTIFLMKFQSVPVRTWSFVHSFYHGFIYKQGTIPCWLFRKYYKWTTENKAVQGSFKIPGNEGCVIFVCLIQKKKKKKHVGIFTSSHFLKWTALITSGFVLIDPNLPSVNIIKFRQFTKVKKSPQKKKKIIIIHMHWLVQYESCEEICSLYLTHRFNLGCV